MELRKKCKEDHQIKYFGLNLFDKSEINQNGHHIFARVHMKMNIAHPKTKICKICLKLKIRHKKLKFKPNILFDGLLGNSRALPGHSPTQLTDEKFSHKLKLKENLTTQNRGSIDSTIDTLSLIRTDGLPNRQHGRGNTL